MESRHEEISLREIPDLDTLQELLARLNEVEHFRPVTRTECVTVEDVAEALNLDPDYVARELESILEEHRDARLAGVIRELEEPLYRVERTGHAAPDPLGNPLYKLRSVQILTERSKEKTVLPRRPTEETMAEKAGGLIGKAIIGLMVIVMLALVAKTLAMIVLAK